MTGLSPTKPILSVIGAALVFLSGLLLWKSPLGEPWVNASYDYLFRFGQHPVTNDVVLIVMDNEAFDQFHQTRGQPWSRSLHTQLVNRLADDDCAMVVFDSFFSKNGDLSEDQALAQAMQRSRQVVLMAEQIAFTRADYSGAQPSLPAAIFLQAARTNWGVAWLDPDLDQIVRHHWPFPSPGPYPSLPETVARLAGAKLGGKPQERWIRYYGPTDAWPRLSYAVALSEPKDYFKNKIVFIGTAPKTSAADTANDAFKTPYTRWTNEPEGGVEIMMASFLNLMNGDWLRRCPWFLEFAILLLSGVVLGGVGPRLRSSMAVLLCVGFFIIVATGAIGFSHYSNFWFPWLVVIGGQVPCALTWVFALKIYRTRNELAQSQKGVVVRAPKIPGYKLIHPPFGEGAYGKVWLAKNKAGEWRALKIIYQEKFDNQPRPFEREFNGINRYRLISHQHAGLLRVDDVSEKKDGYFYYVMELGDSCEPDWQRQPGKYKPRDLAGERNRSPNHRIPVQECVRIGLELTNALEFIHQQGLAHRDIKPQNIIFVKNLPKLADFGLVSEIRPSHEIGTYLGTPGYLPPPPEMPGTPQADIYALGIVLYVVSTGRSAALFPEIATSIVDMQMPGNYLALNRVILKACHGDLAQRYATARELHQALLKLQNDLKEA